MNVIQQAISSIRNKASEMFNDNKGFVQQGKFTLQPVQQAVNYFNPTSNNGNNFWGGTGGRILSGQQQLPEFHSVSNFINQSNAPQPVKFVGSMLAGIPESMLNTPQTYAKGIIDTGGYLGQTTRGQQQFSPITLGAKAAPIAEAMLNVATLPGLASGATQLGKQTFLNNVKSGALGGAKYGAVYGGLGGLRQSEGATPLQAGQNITMGTLQGAGTGAILGGALSAGGYGINKLGEYNKSLPIEKRMGGYTNLFRETIDGSQRTKAFDQAVYNLKENPNPQPSDTSTAYQVINDLAEKTLSKPELKKIRSMSDPQKILNTLIDKVGIKIGSDVPNNTGYKEPFTLKNLITGKTSETGAIGADSSQGFPQSKRLKIKPKELGNLQTEVKAPTDLQTNLPPVVKQSIQQIDQAKTGLNLEVSPVTSTSGSVPRGFTESVQDAPNIAGQTKAGVSGTYTPKANDVLMGEAKALLESGATIDFKNTQGLDKKVAATIQEAINQQNSGNHEAAANLFNNLSEHGTELGRSVQAFNLLQKMSPEAIALSAAGKIKKYNLANPRRPIPELNGAQVKMIADKVQAIDLLKGREKNIALNELGNIVNGFIPSTLGDKSLAIWKAGLLTSFRTHERNFVGNALHGTAELLKDIPATAADIVLSGRTGKRTTTFTTKGLGEFGSKSTRQQMADIVTKGFDPSQTVDKFDYKQITWGKNAIEQTLKRYTDVVFRTLGASDKPFYNASMARSLYDQAGAEAINAGRRGDITFIENLVKNPTEQMAKNAISDANVATFKTKNAVSEVANALKRTLGKNELTKIIGEVTIPFTGVPSSILGQIQAYSPLGLVKGVYKVGDVAINKLPELQRQAVQELGRGVIGTGIFGLGAYLMGKGLITGQPKDATEARQWELENKPRNSIMLGGKWRSLNSVGPEAVVFLAGAKLKEDIANPEGGLGQYAMSLGKDYLDQSFVQGLQGPINAITDPMRYGKSYVGQLASSPIPNIVKDASRALDPNARETNTVLDYVKSGIPGLRNTLTEKRDALGNIIPQEPTGINAFIDLFNSKTPVDNLTVNELARLNSVGSNATPSKMSGTQTLLGNKVKLTFQQLNQLEAGAGQALKPQLEQLILSPTYQQLDDEAKTKAIDKLVTNVRTAFKASDSTNIVPNLTPSPTYKAPAVKKATSTKLKVKKVKKAKKIKISAPKKIKVKKLKAIKMKKPKALKLKFKKTKPIMFKLAKRK